MVIYDNNLTSTTSINTIVTDNYARRARCDVADCGDMETNGVGKKSIKYHSISSFITYDFCRPEERKQLKEIIIQCNDNI